MAVMRPDVGHALYCGRRLRSAEGALSRVLEIVFYPEEDMKNRYDVVVDLVVEQRENPCGAAGFLAAFLGFYGLVPFALPLGLALSVIGLFDRPKGIAVGGVILSSGGALLALIAGT